MLIWEKLEDDFSSYDPTYRAKVPGGWLIRVGEGSGGITFYPDPEHLWDGNTIRT